MARVTASHIDVVESALPATDDGSQGTEQPDLFHSLAHHDDESGGDIEGGDQDDQPEDQEEDQLLQSQGAEELAVVRLPIGNQEPVPQLDFLIIRHLYNHGPGFADHFDRWIITCI